MNQFQFKTLLGTGSPQQARQARFSPWLDFGFQYALIRNNWPKTFLGTILDLAWLKFAMAALRYISESELNVKIH